MFGRGHRTKDRLVLGSSTTLICKINIKIHINGSFVDHKRYLFCFLDEDK